MARPGLKSLGAACLTGTALVIASCSLSTPSPAGGFHHDFTPRTVGPGLMATRLEVTRDIFMMDRIEDGVLLGQAFGMGGGSQIDVVAEARILTLSNHDYAMDSSETEVDGYYLGVQYKAPFSNVHEKSLLLSYFVGAGFGAYGDYVKHVDAHAGAGIAYNGEHFCPFAAGATGFSLPYARKAFDHANILTGGGFGEPERYRYATAAWLGYEGGLESPFGDREKGFRLHMSLGQKIFRMLEKDIVSDREGTVARMGIDFLYKIGLSWTY